LSFRTGRVGVAVTTSLAFLLSACGGGGGGGGTPSVHSTTSPSPSSESAYTCPSSDTSFGAARNASTGSETRRPFVAYRSTHTLPSEESNALVVTYDTSRIRNAQTQLDARAAAYGAKGTAEVNFPRIGRASRLITINPAQIAQAEAALRAQTGVVDVQPIQRRFTQTVSAPYYTADPDPYFFPPSSSPHQPTPPAPLYEQSSYPGQWDMHVIGLQDAFAYSQSGDAPKGFVNANALGSTSVKLAVIDTGADVTQPDIAKGTIARTRCFLTDTNGNQSTGTFVTDPTGHGTDVTGIAGGASGSGFGFEGAAGIVSLMLYRVFPTPDDNCTNPNNTDPQCGAADVDIVSAIEDAVSNGANVINMSFGGDPCSKAGVDPSTAEGNAVQDAINAGVVVVAASGNGGSSAGGVAAPGCDSGVIAAGASAYNDGQKNGSNYTGSSTEYVANYTQTGSTNSLNSASSWGIVAPGGDAASDTDADDLHWIENIWTSTPYMSSPSDTDYEGDCASSSSPDWFGETQGCRTLIDGTSMASPHVAGASALILSATGSTYQSSSSMKTLLCETADSIGTTSSGQGCGRLNVYRAMAKALGDPNLP
jgi:subtilisin family serine protease